MNTGDRVSIITIYIIAGILGIICITPFLYVVGGSFATEKELNEKDFLIVPTEFSINAYRFIINDGRIFRGLLNSCIVTLWGTGFAMLFTTTCAYPLSRRDFRGRNLALNLIIVTMVFSGGMIPGYLLIKNLGMLNSYWAITLPGAISAFNMIIVKNFFQEIPRELEEAARIDGCPDVSIFARIVLPLSKPVLASISLFYAVGLWNDYFNCMLYINDARKHTAQLILRTIVILAQGFDLTGTRLDFGPEGMPPDQAVKLATTVVTTVPILLVYPFIQKFFTKGVMIGAVKG
ncbi:protein LplC [Spirochaetia bacterium]|nr:protein LplC [Spirochaetia bacterium]